MRQKTFCQSPLQCVTFDPPPQTRVAGGDEAGRNEFPWAALILIQVGADQAVCGGTLVSDRWHVARGLARAHCVNTGTWSPRHTAWRIGTLAPLKLGWVSRNSLRYNYTTVDSTICSWQSVEDSHTFWISLKYFLVVWHIIKHIKLFALNVLGT